MKNLVLRWMLAALFLVPGQNSAFADDTCAFGVTTNNVKPNVVLYLDNGAEMEQVTWHSGFDNKIDYTPDGTVDVVKSGVATGTGFYNANGYGVYLTGGKYYLVPIGADFLFDTTMKLKGNVDGGATPRWLINGSTIYLPPVAQTVAVDGAIDNATNLRYSQNYLNWLFYSSALDPKSYLSVSAVDDGTDLSDKSRFYWAKQAIITVMKNTANKAYFAIYYFTNDDGATQKQPLKLPLLTPLAADPADNLLTSEFVNNINGMKTTNYSPLAEGLASVGDYFNSSESHLESLDCAKNFIIAITPGVSSQDLGAKLDGVLSAPSNEPDTLADYDQDGAGIVEGRIMVDNTKNGKDDDGDGSIDDADESAIYDIPTNLGGSTYLDDVAYFLNTHDIGYPAGYQNIFTYTIGFMGGEISNRFLINTSNNGNGYKNLYNTNDPNYGKYHFEATSPGDLAQSLTEAISSILERTNSFTAPVVPVSRTVSGNRLYMSFFTPSATSNFWQGNVVKFGLNENLEIVDKNGDPVTSPGGGIKDTAVPYWATIDWANLSKDNGIQNSARNIYTYLGTHTNLTDTTNEFDETNVALTSALLGAPTHTPGQIINYIRGADVFDADKDTDITENRTVLTGDVLHSEPLVVSFIRSAGTLTLSGVSGTFEDNEFIRSSGGGYATANGGVSGSQLNYDELKVPFMADEVLTGLSSGATATISAVSDMTMIFYGANDGMLHAVRDSDGKEAWGFIPPNQLARLKLMVEAASHQYYVDSSPKIYLHDINGNGFLDTDDGDKMILVCGERKGSTGYFALDVTNPEVPFFLWRINQLSESTLPNSAHPNYVIPQLGESWSEPRFGKIKTSAADTVGTPVVVIGGGYSSTNATGKAVLVAKVLTGELVKIFENDIDGNATIGTNITNMKYSIPSAVRSMDSDGDGFIDKVYVGDTGGQLWRIGRFDKDELAQDIVFPAANENINDWRGQMIFSAGCNESSCTDTVDNNANGLLDEWRQFFYPPAVTLEVGHDLVLIGSGDRENPCYWYTMDEMYAIKDDHSLLPNSVPPPASWTRADLADITNYTYGSPTITTYVDPTKNGWLFSLASGEKVLAESTVFGGVLYFTTYTPNNDPCVPGGAATLYGLLYKSGASGVDFNEDGMLDRSIYIGGGIPSRPVIAVGDAVAALFVSVGSVEGSTDAGIFTTTPPGVGGSKLIWWREKE
jgi:type IV pilus assembly protein PilY1